MQVKDWTSKTILAALGLKMRDAAFFLDWSSKLTGRKTSTQFGVKTKTPCAYNLVLNFHSDSLIIIDHTTQPVLNFCNLFMLF